MYLAERSMFQEPPPKLCRYLVKHNRTDVARPELHGNVTQDDVSKPGAAVSSSERAPTHVYSIARMGEESCLVGRIW